MEEEKEMMEELDGMLLSTEEIQMCIKAVRKSRSESIINTLNSTRPFGRTDVWQVINNHNGDIDEIDAVVEYIDPARDNTQLLTGTPQSLNKLVIGKDGMVHISTWAAGGCITMPSLEALKADPQLIHRVVEDYNNSLIIDGCKIKKIYWSDGHVDEF